MLERAAKEMHRDRVQRWGMLAWLRTNSGLKSQRSCSTRAARGAQVVLVRRAGKAAYRHLVGCKRLDCPVCGPAVAEREAADIGLAVAEHYANGGTVAFVTLTMRHVLSQPLSVLLLGLVRAWTSCRQSKRPRALWSAYTDGFVRKLEVTHGRNGWHPHLHLLVFLRPAVSRAEAAMLFGAVQDCWTRRMVAQGLGEPSQDRGLRWKLLDLEEAEERVAAYMAKDAGRELAAAGTKEGRGSAQHTTAGLLAAAARGDCRKGWLFLEYEDAMRGRSRVEWSAGLRVRMLGELAVTADEPDGLVLAVLSDETLWVLKRNDRFGLGPGLGHLLSWAEVYDDDAEALDLVLRQCAKHGIPPPTVAPALLEPLEAYRGSEIQLHLDLV